MIFDLDETLIHCNESADKNSDAIISIKFPHGEIINVNYSIYISIYIYSVITKDRHKYKTICTRYVKRNVLII